MGQNRFQLRRRKAVSNTGGQQQDLPEDAEHAMFHKRRRRHDRGNAGGLAAGGFSRPDGQIERRCRAQHRAKNSPP
jgi:hypothetical protein